MKTRLFLGFALLASGPAMAVTEHYLLRDGNHVHHLKITEIGDEITVGTDVDFEPNASEAGRAPCSAEVSGEAKRVAANELVLRKQIEGEARHCSLKIHLSPTGAKIEQSEDCNYFAAGLCHFESDGKELIKIK